MIPTRFLRTTSLRLDDQQHRSPVGPQTGEQDPQESVTRLQTKAMASIRTLQDQELMANGNYLELKSGATHETISERNEQGKHGSGSLHFSAS